MNLRATQKSHSCGLEMTESRADSQFIFTGELQTVSAPSLNIRPNYSPGGSIVGATSTNDPITYAWLPDLISARAVVNPNAPAIISATGDHLTYGELDRRATKWPIA